MHDFFMLARPTGGALMLLYIDEAGGNPVAKTFDLPQDENAAIDWIDENNAQMRNIYWLPNDATIREKKPKKSEMRSARFMWADCDPDIARYGSYATARNRLLEEVFPRLLEYATFVIDSGNGLQAFFALDQNVRPDIEYERINAAVGAWLDGPSTFNAERIMRVPGTINWQSPTKRKKGYPADPQNAALLHVGGPVWNPASLAALSAEHSVSLSGTTKTPASHSPDRVIAKSNNDIPPPPRGDAQERFDRALRMDFDLRYRWQGDPHGLSDSSGSAMDMSLYGMLAARDFTHEEIVDIMTPWEFGSLAGRENQGDRYWDRMQKRAFAANEPVAAPVPTLGYDTPPPPPPPAMDAAPGTFDECSAAFDAVTTLAELKHAGAYVASMTGLDRIDREALAARFQKIYQNTLNLGALAIGAAREAVTGRRIMSVRDGDYDRDDKNAIKCEWGNYVKALEGLKLRRDDFLGLEVTDTGQQWADTAVTAACVAMNAAGFNKPGHQDVARVGSLVAQQNRFDSAQDRLAEIEWDGIPRVDAFWATICNAPMSSYHTAVSRYFWSALAGRTIFPGVKADAIVVLMSETEGKGKSELCAAIALEPEHYAKISLANMERDRVNLSRKMRGKTVMEWDEMRGLKTGHREEILSFLSQQREDFVDKFEKAETRFMRRCVFIATTNDPYMLDSQATERRMLPLALDTTIDIPYVLDNRDQLWAEGAALFREHGVMWEDAQNLASIERDAFREEGAEFVYVTDFIKKAVNADGSRKSQSDFRLSEMRVWIQENYRGGSRVSDRKFLNVLRSLGYTPLHTRTGTFWRRP